ncbi:MAG: hypothetical protein LUE27_00105 [Clostridia bacterium]|nr:hypothetical protein [Clostridia bacterium]
MNKITFPRTGVNGKTQSKSEIEDLFLKNVKLGIGDRLKDEFHDAFGKEKDAVEWILTNLDSLLIGEPEKLDELRKEFDSEWSSLIRIRKKKKEYQTDFGKRIGDCFGYKKYRDGFLIEHGGNMNVKCCPYCNQQYTLYIEGDNKGKIGMAKFEYDHFWGKSEYPFLSMSMYNLIPSCPMCNYGKSTKILPLKFNPYYQEIAEMFTYKVKSPARLLLGGMKADKVSLILEPKEGTTRKELDDYNDVFHIKAQAERHKDVVIEAFSRAYVKKDHYSWTYGDLIDGDPTLVDRLRHGTYIRKEDIKRRPLTKLYQDIYNQAKGED